MRPQATSVWGLKLLSYRLCRVSLSGVALDCFLGSIVYMGVALLVHDLLALPALRFVTKFLFPPLLDTLSDFPLCMLTYADVC